MVVTIKRSRTGRFSGFTLIELLVVIAIIALLISIILPGMAEARRLAYKVREMAAAEQKMSAYSVYAGDNKDAQFVGYAPWSVAHLGANAGPFVLLHEDILWGGGRGVEGNCIKINGMRFAGATQMNLEALMIDKPTFSSFNTRDTVPSSSNLPPSYGQATNLYDNLLGPDNKADKAAVIAYHPSLGLNTTFLGGSAHRGAFAHNSALAKWGPDATTRHYTSTTSELYFPSKIVVMASSRGIDVTSATGYSNMGYGTSPPSAYAPNSVIIPGWWEIIPPMKPVVNGATTTYQQPYNTSSNGTPQAAQLSWTSTNPLDNNFDPNSDPAKWGNLDFRHKKQAVAAEADGHVEMFGIKDMRDFHHWSNTAR